MIVQLERAETSDDYGHEETCAVCGDVFRVESVRAWLVHAEGPQYLGQACDPCVGMLSRRKPERFPSPEEVQATRLRFPGPIWDSEEEARRAWGEGDWPTHQRIMAAVRMERAGA